MKTFVLKDDPRLPDKFGVKIRYVNGEIDEFEAASFLKEAEIGAWEFILFEDTRKMVFLSNVASMDFDKRWTTILEIKAELKRKEEEEK